MSTKYCDECGRIVDDPEDEYVFCHLCGEPLEDYSPIVYNGEDEENYDEIEFQNMILEAVKKKYAYLEKIASHGADARKAEYNLKKNKNTLKIDNISLTGVKYSENGKFIGEVCVQDDAKKQVILFYKIPIPKRYEEIWQDMVNIMTYEHEGPSIKNKMLHYETKTPGVEKIFEMGTYLKGMA